MPRKVYIVELTTEEKAGLLELTRKGKVSARKIKRANILLQADKGKTDKEIAESLEVGKATVERTRKKFLDLRRFFHRERCSRLFSAANLKAPACAFCVPGLRGFRLSSQGGYGAYSVGNDSPQPSRQAALKSGIA